MRARPFALLSPGTFRSLWKRQMGGSTGQLPPLRRMTANYQLRQQRMLCSTKSASGKPPSMTDRVIDFVDNNGGKLVLLAISLIGGYVYRSYKEHEDRESIENSVLHNALIEPYEIQLLRKTNGYDIETFKEIVDELRRQSLDWDSTLSYQQLIALVVKSLNARNPTSSRSISMGHLLDRIVQGTVERSRTQLGQSANAEPFYDAPLSVPFGIALMNLAMENNVDKRLEGLFYACSALSDGEDAISRDCIVRLVQALADTDQIPPEKQVERSEVDWPIKLHRRRQPESMVKLYEEQVLKAPEKKEKWTQEDFVGIMKSKLVCTWASCYRRQA